MQAGAGQPAAAPPATDLPPAAKTDLQKANEAKAQAAALFKQKDYNKATEKYYEILNIVR